MKLVAWRFDSWLKERKWIDEVALIAKLPLWKKFFHKRAWKAMARFGVSIFVMLFGAWLASNKNKISESVHLEEFMVDGVAYMIHGLGAIPVVKTFEPVWVLFGGEE